MMLVCCYFIRKVQKSLADLEKLHSSGQGENLFLPTSTGNNNHKVLAILIRVNYILKFPILPS